MMNLTVVSTILKTLPSILKYIYLDFYFERILALYRYEQPWIRTRTYTNALFLARFGFNVLDKEFS